MKMMNQSLISPSCRITLFCPREQQTGHSSDWSSARFPDIYDKCASSRKVQTITAFQRPTTRFPKRTVTQRSAKTNFRSFASVSSPDVFVGHEVVQIALCSLGSAAGHAAPDDFPFMQTLRSRISFKICASLLFRQYRTGHVCVVTLSTLLACLRNLRSNSLSMYHFEHCKIHLFLYRNQCGSNDLMLLILFSAYPYPARLTQLRHALTHQRNKHMHTLQNKIKAPKPVRKYSVAFPRAS